MMYLLKKFFHMLPFVCILWLESMPAYAVQLSNVSITNRLTPVDVPDLASGVKAVAAGRHTCALTTAGGVRVLGG